MAKSEIGVKLRDKLLEFADDRSFAIGVMSNAKTEENWQIILDVMESEKDITKARLLLFSLSLGEQVE